MRRLKLVFFSDANVPNRVAVKHPHYNDKDVGSKPTAAIRNEKTDIGGPPTEGSPIV